MIKCGFNKRCITPTLGTPILGYYFERNVKGVLDDLYVRATALDDGEKKAIVIAVDVCLIPKDMCDELREKISQLCKVDKNAILINASHTHTGPVLEEDNNVSGVKCPQFYEEYFKSVICDTARYAFEDLKPARFFSAENEAKNISFIRRFRMKDGSIHTNPGIGNPEIGHPLGAPDEKVRLLKIVRDGTDDIYIVNFGTHADTVQGEYISADFPGYVCDTIEKCVPGTQCMFLTGSQGDVNHFDVNAEHGHTKLTNSNYGDEEYDAVAHAKHMGRVIAGSVLAVLALAREIKAEKIEVASNTMRLPSNQENERLEEAEKISKMYDEGRYTELPYEGMDLTAAVADARRIVRLKDGPEFFELEIFAIKIGDYAIAGLPGEPFTEIGTRIYERSPFEKMMLCCLINDGVSYFPTSKAMAEGGYEVSTCNFKAGGDDIIVEEMCELLKGLKRA